MPEKRSAIPVEVITEEGTFTLDELCGRCSLESQKVIEMVEVGVLDPVGAEPAEWRFSGKAVYRAQATMRLCRDLELNLLGAALVLDLLEERRRLRAELESLKRQFFSP